MSRAACPIQDYVEEDFRAPARAGLHGWVVAPDGLEHAATGYFIAREALGARRPDGLWEWPLHMAGKAWCAPAAFRAAFLAALRRFGVGGDADLARSFLAAAGEQGPRDAAREGHDRWDYDREGDEERRFVRLGAAVRAVREPRRAALPTHPTRCLALTAAL